MHSANSNTEIFISELLNFNAEPGAQAPIGLLGQAGLAADGNAEIFTASRSLTQDRARRTGAEWPLRLDRPHRDSSAEIVTSELLRSSTSPGRRR